jgi:hypothetical protein
MVKVGLMFGIKIEQTIKASSSVLRVAELVFTGRTLSCLSYLRDS